MQAHEGIGVTPMPAYLSAAVQQNDIGVGMIQQDIDEGQADSTGPHHYIIGFDRCCHGIRSGQATRFFVRGGNLGNNIPTCSR